MAHIDPIKVREERERQSQHAQVMQEGMKAADALLWFDEYAKPTEQAKAVIKVQAQVIASSTPGAQHANEFLSKAVERYAYDILQQAIEDAQRTFALAERLRDNRR